MHAQDEDLERTHQLFAQVGNESYPETDISAEQWLRNKGVNDKILAIADACYANDFGCSLHQLGLRDMITENRKWDSGIGSCSLLCCHKQVYHFITVSLVIHCKCASHSSGTGSFIMCTVKMFYRCQDQFAIKHVGNTVHVQSG